MKIFICILTILFASFGVFGQVVTDQKETERFYRQSIYEGKINKEYFAEDKKCRDLIRQKKYDEAEAACRLATSLVEKLPKESVIERHSAYEALGVALLRNKKAKEAIPIFEKSLEVAKSKLDETDSETAQVYFFIGQAHHLLGNVENARDFYTRAEKVYRVAYKEIDDEEFNQYYPPVIKAILQSHLALLQDAEMKEEAKKIKLRLDNLKNDFPNFKEN